MLETGSHAQYLPLRGRCEQVQSTIQGNRDSTRSPGTFHGEAMTSASTSFDNTNVTGTITSPRRRSSLADLISISSTDRQLEQRNPPPTRGNRAHHSHLPALTIHSINPPRQALVPIATAPANLSVEYFNRAAEPLSGSNPCTIAGRYQAPPTLSSASNLSLEKGKATSPRDGPRYLATEPQELHSSIPPITRPDTPILARKRPVSRSPGTKVSFNPSRPRSNIHPTIPKTRTGSFELDARLAAMERAAEHNELVDQANAKRLGKQKERFRERDDTFATMSRTQSGLDIDALTHTLESLALLLEREETAREMQERAEDARIDRELQDFEDTCDLKLVLGPMGHLVCVGGRWALERERVQLRRETPILDAVRERAALIKERAGDNNFLMTGRGKYAQGGW